MAPTASYLSEFRRLAGISGCPALAERLSSVLYHRTSLDALDNILANDEFRLSTSAGTGSDNGFQPKDKLYFMSCARSPTGHYSEAVTLVLDGEKLGQRYSGGSVDYWGPEFRKSDPRGNEMEDRLYSSKPSIPHAASYITAIHVHMDDRSLATDGNAYTHFFKERMRAVWLAAKKRGIPIFAYKPEDEDAYNLLSTKKAMPFSEIPFATPPGERAPEFSRSKRRQTYIPAFVELYYVEAGKKLSPETAKLLSRMYDPRNVIEQLLAELHNEKKKDSVRSLVAILQKERLDVAGLVDLIMTKWKRR